MFKSGDCDTTVPISYTTVYMYMYVVCMYVCMVMTQDKSKGQPGKVANVARGQLNRENGHFPVPIRA